MITAAYPIELRRKVLAACDSGRRAHDLDRHFMASESWVRHTTQELRELGTTAPLLTRNRTLEWAAYSD